MSFFFWSLKCGTWFDDLNLLLVQVSAFAAYLQCERQQSAIFTRFDFKELLGRQEAGTAYRRAEDRPSSVDEIWGDTEDGHSGQISDQPKRILEAEKTKWQSFQKNWWTSAGFYFGSQAFSRCHFSEQVFEGEKWKGWVLSCFEALCDQEKELYSDLLANIVGKKWVPICQDYSWSRAPDGIFRD